MPRDGSGIYSKPFPDVVEGTTIESAVHNGTVADVETDLNAPRPIVAGGTGANNALGARTNLGAEVAAAQQPVTNYDSHVFQSGSFWSAGSATGRPPGAGGCVGVAIIYDGDPNYITIRATDLNDTVTPGRTWARERRAGLWSAWALEGSGQFVDVGGDIMTGSLDITYNNPALRLNKTNPTGQCEIWGLSNPTARWAMVLGDATAESGGNTGSNFQIYRFNDAGVSLGAPLSINRATGVVTLTAEATAASFRVAGSGVLAGTATYVNMVSPSGVGAVTVHSTNQSYYDNGEHYFRSANGSTIMMTISNANNRVDCIDLRAQNEFCVGPTVVPGALPGLGNNDIGVAISANGYALHSRNGAASSYFNNVVDGSVLNFQRGGATVGTISVTASATAYNTSSDARLKEDLKSFDAGHIIDDTEVYDFKWKDTDARAYGVIAQQAKEVYDTPSFYDKENDRWMIDYSKYVPVLLQELKALRVRVAQLEAAAGIVPPKPGEKPS